MGKDGIIHHVMSEQITHFQMSKPYTHPRFRSTKEISAGMWVGGHDQNALMNQE